ncbi:hypothetical protein DERF_003230 [Dermatophagoides farinae]|uniref:Uncharacterized protein n=1 Tax=Dermatophagoides farinae TaxID=6954 RepID=A0A922IDU8_DERFA|nr:hypothetical protein DERF_003230 [Dermatophagoides farinae]
MKCQVLELCDYRDFNLEIDERLRRLVVFEDFQNESELIASFDLVSSLSEFLNFERKIFELQTGHFCDLSSVSSLRNLKSFTRCCGCRLSFLRDDRFDFWSDSFNKALTVIWQSRSGRMMIWEKSQIKTTIEPLFTSITQLDLSESSFTDPSVLVDGEPNTKPRYISPNTNTLPLSFVMIITDFGEPFEVPVMKL